MQTQIISCLFMVCYEVKAECHVYKYKLAIKNGDWRLIEILVGGLSHFLLHACSPLFLRNKILTFLIATVSCLLPLA